MCRQTIHTDLHSGTLAQLQTLCRIFFADAEQKKFPEFSPSWHDFSKLSPSFPKFFEKQPFFQVFQVFPGSYEPCMEKLLVEADNSIFS